MADEPAPDTTTDEPGPLAQLGILAMEEVAVGPDLRHVEIYTLRGLLTVLWHGPPDAERVVLMSGGAMGGLLGPAHGLYHDLGTAFARDGIGTARVGYRKPNDLNRCIHDVGAVAQLAYVRGARSYVTMGHSFGGAVAVSVALALANHVRGVVTFATQSAGCEVAGELPADVPLLLFHGDRDELLPWQCSETVRMIAGHGELVVVPGAGHLLAEAGTELRARLLTWVPEVFGEGGGEGTERPTAM
jgi:pimeloyl-ACP methyl ester carboxylesterase